ncbi:DEAD/DEAH box helicase [Paramylibacter kogurei]|uniref:DEAD/DEAH box helicase n=1 Tax=Paramylibacter kogurei TaxID=1889778 RepID=UPI000C15D4AE|nr:DEAD/DEAH box helicase [Amylibacter kogurei]
MNTGTVIWYNAKKGIGFIKPDEAGDDVFVHMKALKKTGLKQIKEGDRLLFEMETDDVTGKQAAANITQMTDEEGRILRNASRPAPTAKKQKSEPKPKSDASAFASLGLDPEIVKSLGFQGYEKPTPIQEQAIPAILKGRDIVGLAQTGTGKTAAFSLPLLQNLLMNPAELKPRSARALILSPTRELALQIHTAIKEYGKRMPLTITSVIGGAPIRKQMQALSKGVDVLVATPGRLEDLVDQKALRLDQTNFIVLDEADQMMDIGFLPSIKRILGKVASERQTLLFSATMPKAIKELTNTYLDDPVEVAVAQVSSTAERIKQSLMYLVKMNKGLALERIVKANPNKRIIVFSRTKHGSDKLVKWLGTQDIKADAIHGNKSQGQRQRALDDFRKGKTFVLIATDIAARGIDIPGIELVVNFDLPNVPEAYVHRIGRTARAGAEGRAIAFCAPDEQKQLADILKVIKQDIPVEVMEGLTNTPMPSMDKPAGGRGRASRPPRGGKWAGAGKGKANSSRNKGKPKARGR